ncbi:MAG: hypothetical protein PHS14_15635 [Elusimicrobia bacterium]|nr:hypothetical protein [Elusimicrobiota bacterium]
MKALAIALIMLAASGANIAHAEDWAETAAPVYRGVEAVADGVYGLVRGHLISAVIPGGLSRRMSAVPVGTSDKIFAERLRYRQEKAARRLLEERPIGPMGPAETAAWQRRAAGSYATSATDAVADALVRRYQLERFGRDSGAYASNLSNWDPEFMVSAGILGSAYLYVAGLRTDFNVGPVRVDFDTRPGSAVQGAIQNGEARGLAALTLSRRGSPLSFKTEWGVKDGRPASERVGVNYSTRF